MPDIRPFRALRYDPATIADLALVVAPPYDVIDARRGGAPARPPSGQRRPPRQARANRPATKPTIAIGGRPGRSPAWRSDGTLHKDPHPSIYVYEQTYRVPGTDVTRTQRGFFARLRLAGVRRGRRAAARADDVRPEGGPLQAAAGDGRQHEPGRGLSTTIRPARVGACSTAVTARAADVDLTDDDGVRHRLWAVAADGDAADAVAPLLAAASRGPVTIADGHHRYETALRYRDERRMSRSCEEDPAFDYILTLFIDAAGEPLTVLPTHRIVRGLGDDGAAALLDGSRSCSRSSATSSAADLRERFEAAGLARGGEGRFGLWTRAGGALLTARREAFEPLLPDGGDALRSLDVTLLGAALERLAGIDGEAVAAGAIEYTKSAGEAIERGRGRPRRGGRGVPPRADAGRRGPGRGRRRRRHAPEIDLFLPQGPDRPGHQPARVVNLDARYDT